MKRTILAMLATALLAACQPDVSGPPSQEGPPTLSLPDYTPNGTITVLVDTDSPLANNYLMGTTNQKIATFQFCVSGATEDAKLQALIPAILYGDNYTTLQVYRNARITDYDTGAQYGTQGNFAPTVGDTGDGIPEYGFATIKGIDGFTVANGTCKSLNLLVDFANFGGDIKTTGQTATPVFLPSYSNTPGQDQTVTVVTATTGRPMNVVIKDTKTSPTVPGAYAHQAVVYAAKLVADWTSDSPIGAAAGAANKLIGKVAISNLANNGNFPARVSSIIIGLRSLVLAGDLRKFSLYNSNGTLLVSQTFQQGDPLTGNVNFIDQFLVSIPSGSTRILSWTLDTEDFTQSTWLTSNIVKDGIGWTDGVQPTGAIKAMGQSLPLPAHQLDF